MEQEKIEVKVVRLEDNQDYVIVAALESNNNKYLFLAKENEKFNVTIRKVITKENREYLVKLDSDEEFEEVMEKYNEKFEMKEG